MSTTIPKAPARGSITVPVKLDPETRSATGELRLSGLAAPYNRTSQDIGFYEEIKPGAFHALQDGDVLLLWQHRDDQPLARRSAGNLEITDAADGVRFAATLPSTSVARDAVELVRSGVVTEMSFGFVVEKDKWENRGGKRIRVVERAELFELSLVTEAAYGRATSVANRNRGALQTRIENTVERMRRTPTPGTENPYTPHGAHSWFRDLLELAFREHERNAAHEARLAGIPVRHDRVGGSGHFPHHVHGGVEEAERRLRQLGKHLLETRDLTTTATDGGGFIPAGVPAHVSDAFMLAARSRGVLPSVFPREPLPDKGMVVKTPRISSGADTAALASENAAVNEVDIVEAVVSSPVSTIAGMQDISLQLLERSDPSIDAALAMELGNGIAQDLDTLLFTGSGTAPYLRGLDNVAAISTLSYTDATPTQAELWAKIIQLAATVAAALGKPPTHLLAHSRRIAWLFGSSWSSAPVTLPYGMEAVAVDGITALAGAGTNEDKIYIVAADELPIFIGETTFRVFLDGAVSDTLTARCRAHAYASALFGRAPEAIGLLSGTGLTPPVY